MSLKAMDLKWGGAFVTGSHTRVLSGGHIAVLRYHDIALPERKGSLAPQRVVGAPFTYRQNITMCVPT